MAQWGMYTDEQTKGTATGLGMSRSKYYDPLSCRFLSREDRFGNPYVGGDDGSSTIFFFQVMSAIPGIGAPFALAMGVEDIREGDYVSGGLNIAGALLPFASDAVAVGKGLRVAGEAAGALEVVAQEARLASETEIATAEGNSVRQAVIIGESMESRVVPKAWQLGAQYYGGNPELGHSVSFIPKRQLWEHNKQWLLERIREGSPIYDYGIDPLRATRSRYYAAEKALLKRLRIDPLTIK